MVFKVTLGKDVVTYSKFLAFSFTSEKSHTYSRYRVKKKKTYQQTIGKDLQGLAPIFCS